MKTRVLFVDDEPRVLDGLRRMLRPMRREWEMAFAGGGEEALRMMGEAPFNVVVSDMRMPGMNGAELLTEVMNRYPETVRIVLSGQSKQEQILQSMRPTHQYLSKPCDAETLQKTIQRALNMRGLLISEKARALVTQTRSIPSLPAVYLDLTKVLNEPDPDITDVATIVSRDAAMTARILQVANSVLFGSANIANPRQAIIRLGLSTVKALVLSVHLFSAFKIPRQERFGLEALWSHSIGTSSLAKHLILEESQDKSLADTAFSGGLMHDLGKLILAANIPDEYAQLVEMATKMKTPIYLIEQDRLGACHGQIGAYLVGLWGLPDQIVETLAYHHRPGEISSQDFGPAAATHAANVLEQENRPQQRFAPAKPEIDMDYLGKLGLTGRLDSWRSIRDSITAGEQ